MRPARGPVSGPSSSPLVVSLVIGYRSAQGRQYFLLVCGEEALQIRADLADIDLVRARLHTAAHLVDVALRVRSGGEVPPRRLAIEQRHRVLEIGGARQGLAQLARQQFVG